MSESKILLDPLKLTPWLMRGGLYFSFSQKSVFLKHPSVYVVSLFVIVSVYVLCLCVIVSVYVGSNDIAGKLLLPPG